MQQATTQRIVSPQISDIEKCQGGCREPILSTDSTVSSRQSLSSESSSEDDKSDDGLDVLYVDEDTRSQIAVVAVTLLLFLLTHSPVTPGEPLKGVFAQSAQIAEACFIEQSYPTTSICDILGFASIIRLFDGCEGFLRDMTLTWSRVIWGMCDLSREVYGPNLKASEELRRTNGIGYDFGFDKTLSTYHWHLLREMCYHSRLLENQDPCLRKKERLTPRTEGLSMWFEDEADRETGNRSFVLWYHISVREKIARLQRMKDLVSNRLPAGRAAEDRPPRAVSNLMSHALTTNEETLTDFVEMRGLQEWIQRQLDGWSAIDQRRQAQGLELYNPIYSGFPLCRQYRSGIEAPDPCRQERREGIYPADVLAADKKKIREEIEHKCG